MTPGPLKFDRFTLDPVDRTLSSRGEPVEISARYFDALTLLARHPGQLISKDRFHEEVWRGVPVTDEALTQCVRSLRRALGDDASAPRFIETVPKHGYRFIAPVEPSDEPGAVSRQPTQRATRGRRLLLIGGAGAIGGGVAGAIGGLAYGFAAAALPAEPAMGAASVLVVMAWVSILTGLAGGAGIGFGIAAAERTTGSPGAWNAVGGALGGLTVGGLAKLFGIDAFALLLGRSPGDIAGAPEGGLLGLAIGLGAWLAWRYGDRSLRRSCALGAIAGAGGGLIVALLGGRLMGGSLDLLGRQFPESRLRLDALGATFGEAGFGPASLTVTATIEGMLLGGCAIGAITLARRHLDSR